MYQSPVYPELFSVSCYYIYFFFNILLLDLPGDSKVQYKGGPSQKLFASLIEKEKRQKRRMRAVVIFTDVPSDDSGWLETNISRQRLTRER